MNRKILVFLSLLAFFGCKIEKFDYLPKYGDDSDHSVLAAGFLKGQLNPPSIDWRIEPGIGKITLRWDGIKSAVKYNIYRADSDTSENWEKIGESNEADSKGFFFVDKIDMSGSQSKQYSYRITSVKHNGIESRMSIAKTETTTTGTYQPSYDGNKVISSKGNIPGSGETIIVKWKKIKSASRYIVRRAEVLDAVAQTYGHILDVGLVVQPTGYVEDVEFSDCVEIREGFAIEPGKSYYYWVMPVNSEGVPALRSDFFRDSGFLPALPVLSLDAVSVKKSTGVGVSWSYDNSGLDFIPSGYIVERSAYPGGDAEITQNENGTSWTDPLLGEIKEYPAKRFYRVRAVKDLGSDGKVISRASEELMVLIVSDSSLNTIPANVQASEASVAYPNQIVISWDAVPSDDLSDDGVDKPDFTYSVYRSTEPSKNYSKIGVVGGKVFYDTALTFTDGEENIVKTTADPDTIYYYRVSVLSSEENESLLSDASSGYVLSPPTNLAGENNGDNVSLTWVASVSPLVESYELNRNGWVTPKTLAKDLTSYVDLDIEAGQSYSYTLRIVDKKGNFSGYSNRLDIVSLNVPDFIEIEKMQYAVGAGIPLKWNIVETSDGYRLYRVSGVNTPKKGSFVKEISNKDTLEFLDDTATKNVAYNYYITTFKNIEGRVVESAFSSPVRGSILGDVESVYLSPVFSDLGVFSENVKVIWDVVEGAISYEVEYSIGGVNLTIVSVDTASYIVNDVGLSLVSVKVSPVSKNGKGATSDAASYAYGNEMSPPVNVVASKGKFADVIQLSWAQPANIPQGKVIEKYEIFRGNVSLGFATETSFVDTLEDISVVPGKSYFYAVRAISSGDVAEAISEYVEGFVLGKPSSVYASEGWYQDKIRIFWNPARGANRYLLSVNDLPSFIIDHSEDNGRLYFDYSVDVADVGKDFTFVVSSESDSAFSPSSEKVLGYVLEPVQGLEASKGNFKNYTEIRWILDPKADWYRIYWTDSLDNSWNSIDTLGDLISIEGESYLSYKHTPPVAYNTTPLYYKVQAAKGDAYLGYVDLTSLDGAAVGFMLKPPMSFSVSDNGTLDTNPLDGWSAIDASKVIIQWTSGVTASVGDGLEYYLEYLPIKASGSTIKAIELTVDGSFYQEISDIVPGTPAEVKVYARKTIDGELFVSDPVVYSGSYIPTFNPPKVIVPVETDFGISRQGVDKEMTVKWCSHTGDSVLQYKIERAMNTNSSFTALASVPRVSGTTVYSDSGLVNSLVTEGASGAYFYRVCSINKDNYQSTPSSPIALYKLSESVDRNTIIPSRRDFVDKIQLQWKHVPGVDYYEVSATSQYTGKVYKSIAGLGSVSKVPSVISNIVYDFKGGYDSTNTLISNVFPGEYSFSVRPVISFSRNASDMTALVATILTDKQGSESACDSKGLRELTAKEWIMEVQREIYASLGSLNGIEWRDINKSTNTQYAFSGNSVVIGNNEGIPSENLIYKKDANGKDVLIISCWRAVPGGINWAYRNIRGDFIEFLNISKLGIMTIDSQQRKFKWCSYFWKGSGDVDSNYRKDFSVVVSGNYPGVLNVYGQVNWTGGNTSGYLVKMVGVAAKAVVAGDSDEQKLLANQYNHTNAAFDKPYTFIRMNKDMIGKEVDVTVSSNIIQETSTGEGLATYYENDTVINQNLGAGFKGAFKIGWENGALEQFSVN
ncbi:MAG: hypothetical protein JXR63_13445 [Spirochaetales bacterium]|nr:hypothetical protein [Spirochaetales bacterium]